MIKWVKKCWTRCTPSWPRTGALSKVKPFFSWSAADLKSQDLASIRLLLQNGADSSAVNYDGDGALHILADLSYCCWNHSCSNHPCLKHEDQVIDAVAIASLSSWSTKPKTWEYPIKSARRPQTSGGGWGGTREIIGPHRADEDENLPNWLKGNIPM